MKIKYLISLVCLVFLTGKGLLAQKFDYVGPDKCKKCHNKPEKGQQFKIWSESPHANAMKTLSGEKARAYANEHNIVDPTKDLGCLKCHSTAGNVAESLRTIITIEQGVSCESCHGPGSGYKRKSVMKNRESSVQNGLVLQTRKVCEQCHNNYSPFYKPFDYDEMVKKIVHPNPKTKKE